MIFLLYLAVGAMAGTLAGLFGIGGGMVIVPVLIFAFVGQGVSETILTHMAVATSLTTIVFTSLSSIREHYVQGAVDISIVSAMTVGIIIGTALGVYFIVDVPGPILENIIGVFALLLSAKMLSGWEPPGSGKRPSKPALSVAGAFVGFGSAWFGIGGGTFTVPYLTWMRFSMRHAVATSAACGLPIAITAAISNVVAGWHHPDLPAWSTGFVYWPAVIGIAIASVPFARIGARLAHRLNGVLLKKLFAVLLFVVGVRFLFF